MKPLVRRSNLLVDISDAAAVASAWRHGADAITLNLKALPDPQRTSAGERIREAIAQCARGAAEVFVRVGDSTLTTDLDAAVWPGVRGIMLPRAESAGDVADAAEILTQLERERQIAVGTLQLIVQIGSPAGVWNVRAILHASPRITQIGLDETRLAGSLDITPPPDLDPFVYARGRVSLEGTAAKVPAIGIAYPLSVYPEPGSPSQVHALATRARNSGMKGVLCVHPEWVAPVNAAFTPTEELVTWNRRVREAFAKGIAAGTAAVPLDGRMIDVPVDEWAIVVIATAEACAARDAEKAAAVRAQGAADLIPHRS